MPQLITNKIPNHILIWRVEEPLQELFNMVSLDDFERKIFHSFRSDKRKKEFLSSRILLNLNHLITESNVHYDFQKAPFLPHIDKSISITHSNDLVAISLKEKNERNGLDLECFSEKLVKIMHKFVHPKEESLLNESDLKPLSLIWSSKECMYKMFPEERLNFKEEIRINTISDSTIEVSNLKEGKDYQLNYFELDGDFCVWY